MKLRTLRRLLASVVVLGAVMASVGIAEAKPDPIPDEPINCEDEFITVSEAYDETIVDEEAWTEEVPGTPSQWWNWSPNHDQGPFEGPPSFPSDARGTWQGPHTNGGPDGVGTYNVSNGASGNASWFHREPGTPDTYIEHPAVTHVVHHDAVIEENPNYPCETTTIPDTTVPPTTVPDGDDPTPPDADGCESQHFSLTGNGSWQANTGQEPHLNNPNVTWLDQVGVGLHYTSNGGSGNFDWFFFYPGNPDDCQTTTVPDTTVPDTTVPDTTVPDTTVPDTTVPDTTVPEPPPTTEIPPVTFGPPPPPPPTDVVRPLVPESLPRTGGGYNGWIALGVALSAFGLLALAGSYGSKKYFA